MFKLFLGIHGAFTKIIEDDLCKIKFYHPAKKLIHAQSTRYPSRTCINFGDILHKENEQNSMALLYPIS